MPNREKIMNLAGNAKLGMLIDKTRGEKYFQELFRKYGNDGMIYYRRAQAYEELECVQDALENYKLAQRYFPITKWKNLASQGKYRMEWKLKHNKKQE